jgi:dihydroorotase
LELNISHVLVKKENRDVCDGFYRLYNKQDLNILSKKFGDANNLANLNKFENFTVKIFDSSNAEIKGLNFTFKIPRSNEISTNNGIIYLYSFASRDSKFN